MSWDRTEKLGAALYLIVSGLLAWTTLTAAGTDWRFEFARASDAAGQYLFFSAPILLALCALSAQRRAGLIRELAPVLPQPQLGARATWVPYVALASSFHAIVLMIAVGMAWRSEAAFLVSYQPFLRQFLLIVALAAAGSLIGSLARSVALPGAVMILSLVVAVLLPFTGLRPFLLAGAGTFDFAFQGYSPRLMLLHLLVAVGMLLPTVPWRHAPRAASAARTIASNVLLAVAAVIMVSGTAYSLVDLRVQESCQIQSPTVCAPKPLEHVLLQAADASQSVIHELPRGTRPILPSRLTLAAAGTRPKDPGVVEFDTAMAGHPGSLERSVIATMSGQRACSPDLPPKILQGQVLGSATISGWLQRRLNVDQDGTYPSDMVSRLQEYAAAEQDQIVESVLKQVWSCSEVDLSRLQ